MKKRTLCALGLALSVAVCTSIPVFAAEGHVTASVLNVRSGNSTSSTILGKLTSGTTVSIIDETNGWYQISYNGQTAYVSGEYISTASDSSSGSGQSVSNGWNGPVLSRQAGTVKGPSGKETYYNLDMSRVVSNMKSRGYDGEYWIRNDGVKMFGNYIICAANLNVHPRGSLVESSLGTCIVCDTGGFASRNPYQLDIATNW